MKTQIQLSEVMGQMEKADPVYIDLDTNSLTDSSERGIKIIMAGRGVGKQAMLNELMNRKTVAGDSFYMEQDQEQTYKRLKESVMNTAQVSLFEQPKPLKESYKERFKKLTLKTYNKKKECKLTKNK